MTNQTTATDPVVYNLWHAITAINDLKPNVAGQTGLLGEDLCFLLDDDQTPHVWKGKLSDQASVNDREDVKSAASLRIHLGLSGRARARHFRHQ